MSAPRGPVRCSRSGPLPVEIDHLVRLRVAKLGTFQRLLAVEAGRPLIERVARKAVRELSAARLIQVRPQDADRRQHLVFPAPGLVPGRSRPLLRGDHSLLAHCIASEIFVVLAERGAGSRFVFWDHIPDFAAELVPSRLPGFLCGVRGLPLVSGGWLCGAAFSSAQATRVFRLWSYSVHPLFPSDASFALVLGRGSSISYPDFSGAIAAVRPFRRCARWCFVPEGGLSAFGLLAGVPRSGESLAEAVGGFLGGAVLERPVPGCPGGHVLRGRASSFLAIDLRAADLRALLFLKDEVTLDALRALGCSGILALVSSPAWARSLGAAVGLRDWLWYLVPAGSPPGPDAPAPLRLLRLSPTSSGGML